ncbi:MAG: hypothetical protein WDW38_001599 [Sanguina aurantia]
MSKSEDAVSTKALLNDGCATCGNLAISALGPLGRPKIINATQGSGAGVISSISGRLFQGIIRDGGLLCIHMATRTAEYLGQKPAPSSHSSSLPPLCLNLSTAGASAYVALVRAVLSPKQVAGLSQSALESLCVAVVQAFLAALPDASTRSSSNDGDEQAGLQPPCVRVLPVVGLDREHLSCVEGVLLDLPIAPFLARRLPCRDVVVALFDVSLDVSPPPTEADHSRKFETALQMESMEQGWGSNTAEQEQLLQLADALGGAGVQVVACQKVINPRLQHALQRKGIICLQRLSVLHVTAFAHTTGAVPMSSTRWGKHSTLSLGLAGCISVQEVGPKSLLSVAPAKPCQPQTRMSHHDAVVRARQRPVQTLVMGCLHDTAADELAAAVACALKVLAWSIQVPYAIPGGGCAEVLIAQHVRDCAKNANHMPAVQVAAIEAYASALDGAAVKLVPWDEPTTILDAWHSVVQSHRPAQDSLPHVVSLQEAMHLTQFIGFRHSTSQFSEVVTGCMLGRDRQVAQDIAGAYLLDLLVCKLSGLASAVDACSTMLRIDQCVVANG